MEVTAIKNTRYLSTIKTAKKQIMTIKTMTTKKAMTNTTNNKMIPKTIRKETN